MPKVKIDSIQPHPRNARLGALEEIAESLEAFGQYRPLTVNRRTGNILKGNNTYQTARKLGWKEVEVVFVEVSDNEEKRILLSDNRSHELGSYDSDLLFEVLDASPSLVGTGYDADFVKSLAVYDEGLFDEEPTPYNYKPPEMVSEMDLGAEDDDSVMPWVPEVSDNDDEDDDFIFADEEDFGDEDDDDVLPPIMDVSDGQASEDGYSSPAAMSGFDDPFRSIADYKRTHLIRCGGLSAIIEPDEYERWWDASLLEYGTVEAAGEAYRLKLGLPTPCEKPKVKRLSGTQFVTDDFDGHPQHDLGVETVDIDSLQPHPQNPRKGDVAAIATSLKKNGQYAPIIVNADNTILAGRHTWAAAQMLRWDKIAIHRIDVDEAEALQILLADNRTSDLGTNSIERTVALLNDLGEDISGTGYSGLEAARLLQTATLRPVVGHKRQISQLGTPKMPFTRLFFDDFVAWKDKVQEDLGVYDDKAYVDWILTTIGIDPEALITRKRREGTAV